ncbi:hypothetical protein DPSP01_004634 [Paraphaeosphaeria sporulosa]
MAAWPPARHCDAKTAPHPLAFGICSLGDARELDLAAEDWQSDGHAEGASVQHRLQREGLMCISHGGPQATAPFRARQSAPPAGGTIPVMGVCRAGSCQTATVEHSQCARRLAAAGADVYYAPLTQQRDLVLRPP